MIIQDIIDKKLANKIKREFRDNAFFSSAINDPTMNNSIMGSSSLFSPKLQTSYVRTGDGLNNQPLTAQSVARTILTDILAEYRLKRFPYLPTWEEYNLISHPLYWETYKGEGVLIDLKSAFWAIYSKMPLYVIFWEDSVEWLPYWLYPSLPDDLYQWKLVRNSIPGIWRATTNTRIKDGELKRTNQYFPTTCFPNWNFVQRTLHWFACIARDCGAVHVYSDGYIFPMSADWDWFIKFCEARGFLAIPKNHGYTNVWGLARYTVGEKTTKMTGQSVPTDNIIYDSEWDLILTKLQTANPYYWSTYGTLQEEHRKHA